MNATVGLVQGILADGHTVVSVAVVAEVGAVLADEMDGFSVIDPAPGEEHLVVVTTSTGEVLRATLAL